MNNDQHQQEKDEYSDGYQQNIDDANKYERKNTNRTYFEEEYKLKLVECASKESVGLVLSNVKDNGEPYPHWCVTEVKPNGMGARSGIEQFNFIIQIHNVKISINDDIISVISKIRTELDVYSMVLMCKKSEHSVVLKRELIEERVKDVEKKTNQEVTVKEKEKRKETEHVKHTKKMDTIPTNEVKREEEECEMRNCDKEPSSPVVSHNVIKREGRIERKIDGSKDSSSSFTAAPSLEVKKQNKWDGGKEKEKEKETIKESSISTLTKGRKREEKEQEKTVKESYTPPMPMPVPMLKKSSKQKGEDNKDKIQVEEIPSAVFRKVSDSKLEGENMRERGVAKEPPSSYILNKESKREGEKEREPVVEEIPPPYVLKKESKREGEIEREREVAIKKSSSLLSKKGAKRGLEKGKVIEKEGVKESSPPVAKIEDITCINTSSQVIIPGQQEEVPYLNPFKKSSQNAIPKSKSLFRLGFV